MTRAIALISVLSLRLAGAGATVRLEATADIWVSSFPGEEDHSAGKHAAFKLKTIQEMAVVRFDASPAAGREVLKARLFLRRAGKDMLRYIRVSTVNADWEEGTRGAASAPATGRRTTTPTAGPRAPGPGPAPSSAT